MPYNLPPNIERVSWYSTSSSYTELNEQALELDIQDLSAGDARAIYRNAPVVILDEPTAALDPVAEYEIYERFHDLIKNKTAIYISHRLSSCKFCDKIVVIGDHTVQEVGNHEELMARNGIYADLFQTHAKLYVAG